jgi:hypothetical protein
VALPQNRRGVYVGPGPSWSTLTAADPTDREAAKRALTPAYTRRDLIFPDQGGITGIGSPADIAAPVPWPDNAWTRYEHLVGGSGPLPQTRADVEMARATYSPRAIADRARRAFSVLLGRE